MGAEAGVDPWSNVARIRMGAGGTVSLVEGSSFLVCDLLGDVVPGGSHGLFHRDTRFVSQLELLVDGARPEPLAARAVDPYSARFVLRLPWDGPGDSPLVAVRDRFVGDGLHEDVDITNHGLHPVRLEVELRIDADFADLFEVKRAGGGDAGVVRRAMRERGLLRWEYVRDGFQRATEVHLGTPFDQATDTGGHYTLTLSPGESWHTCVDVFLALDGERRMPKCRCGAFGTLASPLGRRAAAWRARLPSLRSGWDALDHLYRQAADDLAALLMEDPDGAGDLVVVAGLPWFMTLFGRDAIWTALMALPFDTELAGGVLRTLAHHQGTREDPVAQEQPGKILHELRSGELAARNGRSVYYGTGDATPLFVTLVAEAWRWGMAWEQVAALLPAVGRALGWMRGFGDPDGDVTRPPIRAAPSPTFSPSSRRFRHPAGRHLLLRLAPAGGPPAVAGDVRGPERRPNGGSPLPAYDKQAVVQLQEWTAEDGCTFLSMPQEGVLPNFFTINGKAFPATEGVQVKQGQRLLLRFIGSSTASHPLRLHGGPFQVVATDGNPLHAAARLAKDTSNVAPESAITSSGRRGQGQVAAALPHPAPHHQRRPRGAGRRRPDHGHQRDLSRAAPLPLPPAFPGGLTGAAGCLSHGWRDPATRATQAWAGPSRGGGREPACGTVGNHDVTRRVSLYLVCVRGSVIRCSGRGGGPG